MQDQVDVHARVEARSPACATTTSAPTFDDTPHDHDADRPRAHRQRPEPAPGRHLVADRRASTYYASYSYSFLPSGEQLSLAPNTADLAPETAKNYEIGARWDLLPQLALSAAIFRLDRDDVRSPDPANPGFFIKTGQQRTEGFELGAAGRGDAELARLRRLRATSHGSHHEDDLGGDRWREAALRRGQEGAGL